MERIKTVTRITKKTKNKARWDSKQLVIDPLASIGASERKKQVTTVMEYKITIYYCPFCLYYGQHRDFETLTKKGKPSKKIECPECKVMMLDRTLTEKMNAEQYAEWCFDYSSSGFWRKINFDVWKGRLYKLGMSKKFWDKYKLLKGARKRTESYEEHMEEEQAEWIKYQQQEEQEKEQWAKEQEG